MQFVSHPSRIIPTQSMTPRARSTPGECTLKCTLQANKSTCTCICEWNESGRADALVFILHRLLSKAKGGNDWSDENRHRHGVQSVVAFTCIDFLSAVKPISACHSMHIKRPSHTSVTDNIECRSIFTAHKVGFVAFGLDIALRCEASASRSAMLLRLVCGSSK